MSKTLGVYPGTFNPFHKGHKNILDKAKAIFDEVIVACGVNPEKSAKIPNHTLDAALVEAEVVYFDGWTTDIIDLYRAKLNGFQPAYSSVTIIRGIRNTTDYAYEMNQLAFMRELLPDVEIVMIPCDRKYEHISSSSLRKLSAFGDEFNHYIVTPK